MPEDQRKPLFIIEMWVVMNAISYTEARNKLATTMDRVCDDRTAVIITRQNAESVVMMPLAEYQAIQETAYLLRSPANAEHLARSLAEAEAGDVIEMDLGDEDRVDEAGGTGSRALEAKG